MGLSEHLGMGAQPIKAIRQGKWATCCLPLRLVPAAQHYKSRLVRSTRVHCLTIIRSSVGVVAPMASWALALLQPSAMVQARWATHWSPWRLPLVAARASSWLAQTTRAPFSITRRWSVGVEVVPDSWVRVQSPTLVTRVLQLLLQHLQSIWVLVAPHLR